MRLAIISDLHANLPAVQAVLADIDAQKVDEVVCLGDVVGYGPDPIEVTDLAMSRSSFCVMGNHDEALVNPDGAIGFNGPARRAIEWTREQMKPGFFSGSKVRARWEWLASLPLIKNRGPDLFVHGSPRDPTTEYVLEQDLAFGATQKYEEIFESFERFCFVGHSHLPLVIDGDLQVKRPSDLPDGKFKLASGKALVNVGSVGQPRDGDVRSCYVILDGETVEWRRVAYDVSKTIARFAAIGKKDLDPRLAERLLAGA
jgi:diadenosine tetraphosphatase ApaH/serine/threonine PP2A family protein phosphatase